ncbi:hypothetical protein QAD02_000618 [Eretmocerus hayati]|uniref:Uncharacterized protein n=2 Tax=Eretmocerus hayati TaxID=131215 RepID=A0ACC2NGJ1_9HYME|nr:hypothetical protein QAD02_000616 [Eretmocerus hayati]KAJ8669359.1 hypothetical protein QAD02_000618 [Eretmocerus hayati]
MQVKVKFGSSRRGSSRRFLKPITVCGLILGLTVLFCEFLIHFIVIMQCEWPVPQEPIPQPAFPQVPLTGKALPPSSPKPIWALFLADPHILGWGRSIWLDRLLRDWQMKRMFQAAIMVLKPHVVFILGDIFDEGFWAGPDEFDGYIVRYRSIFSHPQSTELFVLGEKHDIGFYEDLTPFLNSEFKTEMLAPSVRKISLNEVHFVLINSMLKEGNGCSLCDTIEDAIHNIVEELKCSEGNVSHCSNNTYATKNYSRPILLQHFSLFRESDEICHEPDEAPNDIENDEFVQKWDCLSKEATKQLLDTFNPRLVVNRHTHHGCQTKPRENTLEITVPSFSWRNKNNPYILLGSFTPVNYAVSKCYLTLQSTVIAIYAVIGLCLAIYFFWPFKKTTSLL